MPPHPLMAILDTTRPCTYGVHRYYVKWDPAKATGIERKHYRGDYHES